MSEPVFCGRCKHYGWSYDVECCRPCPPVEMNYYGWHKKTLRPRDQNEHNDCMWYEPNWRERLRRWWDRRMGGEQ